MVLELSMVLGFSRLGSFVGVGSGILGSRVGLGRFMGLGRRFQPSGESETSGSIAFPSSRLKYRQYTPRQ